MVKTVMRAYKYRFYPTPEQAQELCRTFGCVRKVWNLALAARTAAWHQRREHMTYLQSSALYLAKMTAPLPVAWSRPLPDGAGPSTVTVSRDAAGRWFVSLLCQCPVQALPASDSAVGVDAGIMSLVTLSTGEKVANPRHERRDRARLVRAQRRLARTAAGSANRDKARVKVARVHARITDRRRAFLHKLTTRLVRDNQAVVIEDLSVRNLVRNHHLARAISNAAWRQMRDMLEYKCDWYGRDLIVIDRLRYPA